MKSQDARPDSIVITGPEKEVKGINQTLNKVLGATSVLLVIFIVVAAMHEKAIGNAILDNNNDNYVRVPVWERGNYDYITNEDYGYVMEFGEYEVLETDNEWNSTHHFVNFELPLSEGGSAPNGVVSLAVWLPDVPEGVTVPVIAEFGPYFDEISVETPSIEVPGTWLGQMIIDQILPHGYAFAQVSVMGTGRSNHCMDLMGNAEQLGVDAAVSWLGTQEWSNGNVGMIGKSYDGTTPCHAAIFGNPHL